MSLPSLLDAQAGQVLARLNAVTTYLATHVDGVFITDGGTTQASGAGTAPNIDLDNSAGLAFVNGTAAQLDAAADFDSTAGSGVAWGATSGKAVVGAVVYDADAGALDVVLGTVAATADVEAPDDDAIDTALGHESWVRVADVTFTRTGDTTITVAVDHTVRPSVGDFAQPLAETNVAYRIPG